MSSSSLPHSMLGSSPTPKIPAQLSRIPLGGTLSILSPSVPHRRPLCLRRPTLCPMSNHLL
eukprot:4585420-Pyramimonas_sp.AAC.1